MRFRPLQRSLADAALSGGATLRTIPLRCSSPLRYFARERAEKTHSHFFRPEFTPRWLAGRRNRTSRPGNDWARCRLVEGSGRGRSRVASPGRDAVGPSGAPGVVPFAVLVLPQSPVAFPRWSTHLPLPPQSAPEVLFRGTCRRIRIRSERTAVHGLAVRLLGVPCDKRCLPTFIGQTAPAMGFTSSRFSDTGGNSPFFELRFPRAGRVSSPWPAVSLRIPLPVQIRS